MRLLPLLICGFLLVALPAEAQLANDTDYSQNVGTTPVQILAAVSSRSWIRIVNVSAPGGPTAWCSRTLTTTLAPYMPGSFPIGTFGNANSYPSVEEWLETSYIPNRALWCVASSGTVALTVNAAPT